MMARLFGATVILFCLELGLFLLVVPWTSLWQHNYFLFRWPELTPWLANYYLRGAISGLGLIDLGLALRYLYRFQELAARIETAYDTGSSRQDKTDVHEPSPADEQH